MCSVTASWFNFTKLVTALPPQENAILACGTDKTALDMTVQRQQFWNLQHLLSEFSKAFKLAWTPGSNTRRTDFKHPTMSFPSSFYSLVIARWWKVPCIQHLVLLSPVLEPLGSFKLFIHQFAYLCHSPMAGALSTDSSRGPNTEHSKAKIHCRYPKIVVEHSPPAQARVRISRVKWEF